MRAIRGLTVASLVLLNAGMASGQATRGFKDSWFWGAKVGLHSYQIPNKGIPSSELMLLGGGEWLITRTNGGLYFSFDHSFFSADSVFVNDSLSPLDVLPRVVTMSGLRRYTIAGMLFPKQTYRLHPYIGFGVTMSHISSAEPQQKRGETSMYRNSTQQNLVLSTIEFFRSTATPIVLAGAQLKLPLASAFVHATATPANNNFFMFTGSNFRTTVEVGLRYNAGTSIERTR